ncbi:MAG: HD domain-containing phosphohydrolase [Bacillota bacterium]
MIPSSIQLANLVGGLSLAVDLAESKTLLHARDVAYLSLRLAEKVNLPAGERDALYYASLLHDIAITSRGIVCPICEAARDYDFEGLIPVLFKADTTLHFVLESWDGSGPRGLMGDNIPMAARLLALAVEIDSGGGERADFWKWRQRVLETLKTYNGNRLDPLLARAMEELLRDRHFSLELFDPNYDLKIQPFRPSDHISTGSETLDIIGNAFAIFIDTKTPYTADHSRQVAEVALLMARSLGMGEAARRSIYLAALLHDIGKICIPNAILEKAGDLTDEEYSMVKNHPYYSALILNRIPEFETIGLWVSAHHERIDGSGYYLGMRGEEMPLEARLIAVADVYSALAADRPYRRGMDRKRIVEVMHGMAKGGHLDKKLVDLVIDLVGSSPGYLFNRAAV